MIKVPNCRDGLNKTLTEEVFEKLGQSVVGAVALECGLTGELPRSFDAMPNLEVIQFGYNHFEGSLPSSLGKLKKLQWASFVGNGGLTGGIPEEVSEMSSLQFLDLSDNSLEGGIPASLQQLSGTLKSLVVTSNNLNGTFPLDLTQFKHFKDFSADDLERYIQTRILDGNNIERE